MVRGRYSWGVLTILRMGLLLTVLMAMTCPCFAGDPAKSFEDLFGADAKKAASSRNTKDAADFAVKMLETAQKVGDDPAFKEYLLNKVCEFAMKDPSGFVTAVQAVEILMADFEVKKDIYADKLLGLYQTQYEKTKGVEKVSAGEEYAGKLIARGDELMEQPQPANAPASGPSSQPAGPQIDVEAINSAIKFYRQAQMVAGAVKFSDLSSQITQKINDANGQIDMKRRYDDLSARYAAKPDDPVTAKALTLLCLLELDDPALASRYSSASGDEVLKLYVPLAAKPLKDLQEDLCMELANWFKAMAGSSSSKQAKINAYSRCKSYLVQFMAIHSKADTEQIKAQKMLEETGAELAKLDPAGTGGTGAKVVRLNLPQKTGIIWDYETKPLNVNGIVLSPDCKKLLVVCGSEGLIFDVETRKEIFRQKMWFVGAFTADSKVILLAPGSAYEIKTGKPLIKDAAWPMWANGTPCFSPDGKYAFGFLNHPKDLEVVEMQTGKKVKIIPLEAKGDIISPVAALSPDGKQVMVSGIDEGEAAGKQRFCKLFDLASEKVIQTLPCFQETGNANYLISYLTDGKRAIGYNADVGYTIWDIRNGKVLSEVKKKSMSFAFTPDGKKVAFAGGRKVEIVDAASGKTISEHTIPDELKGYSFDRAACFTPDGQYLFCSYTNYRDKNGVFLIGIGR